MDIKKLLFVLLLGGTVMAQQPANFPIIKTSSWYEMGFLKADSGLIAGLRDTSFRARYPFTIVGWQNPGIDSSLWFYNGARWQKILKFGDAGFYTQNDTLTTNRTVFGGAAARSLSFSGLGGFNVASTNSYFGSTIGFASVGFTLNYTDAIKIPAGTTAQRPTGAAGLIRYNSTLGVYESYNVGAASWDAFGATTFTIKSGGSILNNGLDSVFLANSTSPGGPYQFPLVTTNIKGIVTAITQGTITFPGSGTAIANFSVSGAPATQSLTINKFHDSTYLHAVNGSWGTAIVLDTAALRAAFGGGGGGGNFDVTLALGGSLTADRTSTFATHKWNIDGVKMNYTHPFVTGAQTYTSDSTVSGGTFDVLRINSAFATPNVPYTIRYAPASNGDGTVDQVLMQGFNIDRSFNAGLSSWKTSLEYHYLGSLHEYHLEFQNPAGEVARVMSFTLSEGSSLNVSASNLYFKINHIEMRAHAVGDTAFATFGGDVRTATTFTLAARDGLSQFQQSVSANTVTTTGLNSSTNFLWATANTYQFDGVTGVISRNVDATSSANLIAQNNLSDRLYVGINGNSAGGIYNRMAEIFSTAPSQVQRISWGGVTYPNIILIGDYGNYTPLTTGNYHAQVIDRFYVAGAEKLNDTLQMPNLIQKSIDTTNLKVLVADASGNTYKMYWPATGGGGGTPDTLANPRAGDTIFTNPSSHRFLLKADSAVVGAGIKISTNDSLLFFKVDTALIATQSYVLAHSGGGGSQTLQQVITTGSTLTGDNTITNTSHKLTFSGGEYDITTGTLAGDGSQLSLNLAATFAGSPSADVIAEQHIYTAAGSANHAMEGFVVELVGSYTGTNETDAAFFYNASAGHGVHSISGNGNGNFSAQYQTVATTIGSNIGSWSEAGLGNLNIANENIAIRTKASSTNIGAVLDAYNSGSGALMVGAQIGLGPGLNLPAASTALWIDNEVGGATPAMIITGLTTAPGAFNVMVHANTSDSTVYQVTQASLTGVPNFANTNLTQTANRSYAGATFNLSMNNMGTVLWNTVGFGLQQSTGPIYTFLNNTSSAKTLQVGYTPTALGNFSKGTAIVIDTNNNIAFGAVSPVSTLPGYSGGGLTLTGGSFMIGSSLFKNVLTVTNGTTSIGAGYCYIVCDATSGNVIINLPAASTVFGANEGIEYTFYRPDATGNTITVNRAGSDLINGATSFTLGAQYETKKLQAISTSAWALN